MDRTPFEVAPMEQRLEEDNCKIHLMHQIEKKDDNK